MLDGFLYTYFGQKAGFYACFDGVKKTVVYQTYVCVTNCFDSEYIACLHWRGLGVEPQLRNDGEFILYKDGITQEAFGVIMPGVVSRN